jgi:hypothetical protein
MNYDRHARQSHTDARQTHNIQFARKKTCRQGNYSQQAGNPEIPPVHRVGVAFQAGKQRMYGVVQNL